MRCVRHAGWTNAIDRKHQAIVKRTAYDELISKENRISIWLKRIENADWKYSIKWLRVFNVQWRLVWDDSSVGFVDINECIMEFVLEFNDDRCNDELNMFDCDVIDCERIWMSCLGRSVKLKWINESSIDVRHWRDERLSICDVDSRGLPDKSSIWWRINGKFSSRYDELILRKNSI